MLRVAQSSCQLLATTWLLQFVVTFGGGNPATIPPVDFTNEDLVNYIAVPIKMNSTDASRYCQETYGTFLATADSDLAVLEVRATAIAAGLDDQYRQPLWIGLTIDGQGNTVWQDGTPLTNDRWYNGLSGLTECGIQAAGGDWLIYVEWCNEELFFVCNAPIVQTLSPSQLPSDAPTITHKRSGCPVPGLEPCESFRCLGTDKFGNDENPNCIKKRPWGCKECDAGFFRETIAHHACVECSTIEGCLDCKDWTGCSQCDEANGYIKRWNKNCGFFTCKL